jgi:hypothetical protein
LLTIACSLFYLALVCFRPLFYLAMTRNSIKKEISKRGCVIQPISEEGREGTVCGSGKATALLGDVAAQAFKPMLSHAPTCILPPFRALRRSRTLVSSPIPFQTLAIFARFHSDPNTRTASMVSVPPVWSAMPEKKK